MAQYWQPIIGLEIHAQLKTKSKMFCSCANDPAETQPNINICEVCLGHPGALPTINQEAVKKVIKTGLALHCQIPQWTKFDRKNYFYPDLPKGYQISQYDQPLARNGWLEIDGRKIRIERIHLEEDTGKLLHLDKEQATLVDFNRAGIPLMEMVTKPDLRTGEEVRKFAKEFQLILRYLGVSEADMEKGQMRVEVNISLIREGDDLMSGTKVEIKNLNSFRVAKKAVEYETVRQRKILENHVDLREDCSKCWARYLCGGGCIANNVVYYGTISKSNQMMCDLYKHLIELTVWLYSEVYEEEREFIERICERDERLFMKEGEENKQK